MEIFRKLAAKREIERCFSASLKGDKELVDSIAIGKFDGLHVAHQELFHRLDKSGAIIAVDSGDSILTPSFYRYEFVDIPIYTCSFHMVKDIDGVEFIKAISEEFPAVKKVIVGYDFRFGKDRLYCADDLHHLFAGEVVIVDEVRVDGMSVHSGIIKELIRHGDIAKANRLLSRPYRIYGDVIKGQGLGKRELYATLNLDVNDFLVPLEGVYATRTMVDCNMYDSVSFVGHRVSTDRKFSIETHILDREISFQDGLVAVDFYVKIRDNHRYDNLEELKRRIELDICEAKDILGANPNVC